MKDKFLLGIFLIAYGSLCFICGATAIYFKLPAIMPIVEAFEGGKTWYALQKNEDDPKQKRNIRRAAKKKLHKLSFAITQLQETKAYDGFTLISHSTFPNVQLIDLNGNIQHQWQVPFEVAFPRPTHIHNLVNAKTCIETALALPNGDLLVQYSGVGDTPYGYGFAKFDRNSKLLWSIDKNTHHDLYISRTDNNIYAIGHEFVTQPVKGFEYLGYPQLLDSVLIYSSDGKYLKNLPILDAFRDTKYAAWFKEQTGRHKPEAWDAMHTNSIRVLEADQAKDFPMFEVGDYLVSIRNIQAVAVISAKTEKVIWAYRGAWDRQHSASFTTGGNILVLNNHAHKDGENLYSSIMAINLVSDQLKVLYIGNKDGPFYTYAWGRLQKLANGNILAAESAQGRIIEITPDKEIVWEYRTLIKDRSQKVVSSAMRYGHKDLPFLKQN